MFRLFLVAASLALGGFTALRAEEAPPGDRALATKLVAAIANGDYSSFVADADTSAQPPMPKPQFDSMVSQLGPRFRSGYRLTYLGELRKSNFEVTLWKITFNDGQDDQLASLSTRNGRVGGFWIE